MLCAFAFPRDLYLDVIALDSVLSNCSDLGWSNLLGVSVRPHPMPLSHKGEGHGVRGGTPLHPYSERLQY